MRESSDTLLDPFRPRDVALTPWQWSFVVDLLFAGRSDFELVLGDVSWNLDRFAKTWSVGILLAVGIGGI